MDGLAIARFLIGVLHDHYQREEREEERIERRWRSALKEFESDEYSTYTVEQWQEYIRVNSEASYAIAFYSSTSAILAHLDRLKTALDG